MANFAYTRESYLARTKGLDLTSDTIKMMVLVTDSENKDHDSLTDILTAGVEAAVSGYARATLASKTLTIDDTNDRVAFDAADVTMNSVASGETWTGVVVYLDGANDGLRIPLYHFDISQATNGSNIVFQWNATGIATFASA